MTEEGEPGDTRAGDGLRPARRRGLADEVADRIREAIFSGVYTPGAQLREVELAGALDVSRGPVREALLRLEREGLVETAWHRGATVTSLSPGDAAELDSLRAALDALAVEQVVAHATDDELAAIGWVVAEMAHAADPHAMLRLDMRFHDAVYAAAHHRRLEQAWQAIRSQVYLFLLMRVGLSDDGYVRHVREEHAELLRLLRTRDAEAALRGFAEHRRHAFDLLNQAADTSQGRNPDPE